MTFREKIAKEHPYTIDSNYAGAVVGCPCNYGYESLSDCPCRHTTVSEQICLDCWDREIPGTSGGTR